MKRTVSWCVFLLLAGCAYRAGFGVPGEPASLAVPVFENKTFYRAIGERFTLALRKEIARRMRVRLCSAKHADMILSGSMEKVSLKVLREDVNSLPQEVQLMVVVEFGLRRPDGRVVLQPTRVNRVVTYAVAMGESREVAMERALQDVAREVVFRVAEQWISNEGGKGGRNGQG